MDEVWLHTEAAAARSRLVEIARTMCDYELDEGRVAIEVLPAPHLQKTSLPFGAMGLYSFWLGQRACKVGMVSPNDGVRFRYHHYSPNACGSTLARSIAAQPDKIGLPAQPKKPRTWIEENLSRINYTMPAAWGPRVLKLFESALHTRWCPIYEGRGWRGHSEELPPPQIGSLF